MRIPRFVFALMLLVILALSGGPALITARLGNAPVMATNLACLIRESRSFVFWPSEFLVFWLLSHRVML